MCCALGPGARFRALAPERRNKSSARADLAPALRCAAGRSSGRLPLSAQAQDIVVGRIAPFTVLPSPDAHEINQGAHAYFDQINEAGGIGGRRISFFKLDDKFNGDEFALQLEVARAPADRLDHAFRLIKNNDARLWTAAVPRAKVGAGG